MACGFKLVPKAVVGCCRLQHNGVGEEGDTEWAKTGQSKFVSKAQEIITVHCQQITTVAGSTGLRDFGAHNLGTTVFQFLFLSKNGHKLEGLPLNLRFCPEKVQDTQFLANCCSLGIRCSNKMEGTFARNSTW